MAQHSRDEQQSMAADSCSPLWGLVLVLADIAERLERSKTNQRADPAPSPSEEAAT